MMLVKRSVGNYPEGAAMSGIANRLSLILRSLGQPRMPTIIGPGGTQSSGDFSGNADDELDETLGPRKRPRDTQSGRGRARIDPLAKADLVISPAFKFLLLIVVALIAAFLVLLTLIALFGDPANASLQTLSNTLTTLLTAAVGAVLGLLGGKVT
jgi:hypothetical protein